MVERGSSKEIILEGVDYECDVIKRCFIEVFGDLRWGVLAIKFLM